MHDDRWLDVLFGMGDDDFPIWLMAVRANILLFLVCAIAVAWRSAVRSRSASPAVRRELYLVLALTVLAGGLRFLSGPNLLDFGGIPYSRLLSGYKGHFATAQFYALFYEWTSRDIEHAILFDRIAGTLTVPLVYALCRHLERGLFPAVAAFLFAVYPLHILFSASDVLAVFSLFLAAVSYTLVAGAGGERSEPMARLRYLGGFAGLVLLTQVRYENVLFAAPAIGLLILRRSELRARLVLPGLSVAAVLALAYAYWAISARLSFQNPVKVSAGLEMVVEHVLLNPFVAAPLLLVATAIGAWCGGRWFALAALYSWGLALVLPIASESGHGASRVFASWLILLIPLAAFGPARWLAGPSRAMRLAGALVLLSFAALPVIGWGRLTARHLEILEHEFFRAQLAALPAGVTRVIVPDDEILRRRTGSTIELDVKYAFTLAGMPDVRERLQLIKLTQQLENDGLEPCTAGRCVFFFGLPCLEQRVYPYSREQCEALLAKYVTSLFAEREVEAAPFMDCSIYIGEQHRRICEPAVQHRRFAFYSIERER